MPVHKTNQEAEAMEEIAETLSELQRPIIIKSNLKQLPETLLEQAPEVRFDCILGRNALRSEKGKSHLIRMLSPWLSDRGILVLAENIPRLTQRIYQLLTPEEIGQSLYDKWIKAEEAIYQSPDDPMFNWDDADLNLYLKEAGFRVEIEIKTQITQLYISPALLRRWFAPTKSDSKLSYAACLRQTLAPEEVRAVQKAVSQKLSNQTVSWSSKIAYCYCQKNEWEKAL